MTVYDDTTGTLLTLKKVLVRFTSDESGRAELSCPTVGTDTRV
jgi:hypothetical protein